jgi:hypothetical protein
MAQRPRAVVHCGDPALPIDFIIAANVKQNDFYVRHFNGQDDPVAEGDADRLKSLQLAAEGMVTKLWLKRICLEIAQRSGQRLSQFGVSVRKLPACACETSRLD